MRDELLSYYNGELEYLRTLGREFAELHPDVAPQLRIEAGRGLDPYVERLIEAVAYINARTRKKLDDDFPEIAEAMLGVLYPHYLAPIPSMAIAQLELDPGQASLIAGYEVPRGSEIETEEVDGEPCRYRTCYPLRLLPIRIAEARLTPTTAGRSPFLDTLAALRLRLASFAPDVPLSAMTVNSLTFFLSGEPTAANATYELILNNAVGCTLEQNADDRLPTVIEGECLTAGGFGRDEAVLPFGPRSFPGYRLLTEYFALPEKFRFFTVNGLTGSALARAGSQVDLVIYVNQKPDELVRSLSAQTFRLGCTPIINLFEHQPDPFKMSQARSRYHVLPDARRRRAVEIYSIDEVTGVGRDGVSFSIAPLYSARNASQRAEQQSYWISSRRPVELVDGLPDGATELDLTFVNLDFWPAVSPDSTIRVQATCLNRNLPARLEYGGDRPRMRLVAGGPLAPIRCLTPPTPTRRPVLGHGVIWKLVSHLRLNHLSLVDDEKGAEALREILRLYDFVGTPDMENRWESIRSVSSRRRTAGVVQHDGMAFCRGLEVRIEFDEQRFADRGLFLFVSVLERFLALSCTVNSFSQLVAVSQQTKGKIKEWKPRAGDRQLL